MASGTVKWFNAQKGYGFIQPDDGSKDVFVHISAVERAGLSFLNENQKLSYELERGQQGKITVNGEVRPSDGAEPALGIGRGTGCFHRQTVRALTPKSASFERPARQGVPRSDIRQSGSTFRSAYGLAHDPARRCARKRFPTVDPGGRVSPKEGANAGSRLRYHRS